ncbi:hypothetical protein NMG60_11016866 [Bertholletia excelsa]
MFQYIHDQMAKTSLYWTFLGTSIAFSAQKQLLNMFHFTMFFACMRLREQEIRNLMWTFECLAQSQKSRVHECCFHILVSSY